MAVSAGELNRIVVLKSATYTRDAGGSKKTTHTEAATVRASIKQTSQQRALEVAPVLLNTDKVIIRYSSTVSAINKDWLINYDDKDHVIQSIETEGKKFITLIVKAKE